MDFLNLLVPSSMAALKVLLLTGVGLFLSTDRINLLGPNTTRGLNNLLFFVFNPAYMLSSLSRTITFQSLVTLWFMPVNLLLVMIIGSALAWILIKLTRTPPNLRGLVIGSCNSGNYLFLLIIAPAVCEDSNSPFGDSSVCSKYAEAYALLTIAVAGIYVWTYVFAVMGNFAKNHSDKDNNIININVDSTVSITSCREIPSKILLESSTKPLLPSTTCSNSDDELTRTTSGVPLREKMIHSIKMVAEKLNLKMVFTPATMAVIVGFIIGIVSPIRKTMIGDNAPLRVIESCASVLGDASVPSMTLVLGANLLKGLKKSGLNRSLIIGIIVVRYILLPLLGIAVVIGARHFGMVGSDSLYQFVLLLQFAAPPPMAIGTISQLLEVGVSEASIILLWTNVVASIAVTLWTTFYLWLLA